MEIPQEVIEKMAEAAESLEGYSFAKTAQVMFGVPDLADATVFEKIGTDFFLAERDWTDIADGLEAAEALSNG